MQFFAPKKTDCISDVSLMVMRYKEIAIPQVCYETGGSQYCHKGDDYEISEYYDENTSYDVFYKRTNNFGTSGWLLWGYRPSLQGKHLPVEGRVSGSNKTLILYYTDGDTGELFEDTTSHSRVTSFSIKYEGEIQYQIKIFLEGELVYEDISNDPISAWEEEGGERCTIEESAWKQEASWRQLPSDQLLIIKQDDCLVFVVESYFYPGPDKGKGKFGLGKTRSQGAVRQVYIVYRLCRNDDCEFPLFRLEEKSLPGTECYPDCPPGTTFNPETRKCVPEKPKPKCPKCPPGTAYEWDCGDILCCYDECGNIIASYSVPPECQ